MAPKRGGKAAETADEDYSSWDMAQLKSKAQELGIRSAGSKKDLIERLKECAPAPKAKAKAKAAAAAQSSSNKRPAPDEAKAAPEAKRPKAAAAKPEAKAKAATGRGQTRKAAEQEEAEEEKEEAKGKASRISPKAKAETKPSKVDAKAEAKGKAKAKASPPTTGTAPPLATIKPAEGQVFYEEGEFLVELAKSSRASCRKCNEKIETQALRIGKLVPSDTYDGKYTLWYHAACFLSGNVLPSSTDLLAGFTSLRPEEQAAIAKVVPKGGGEGGTSDSKLKTQSKKLHEVQDALAELSTAELNELAELNGYPIQKLKVNSTLLQLCADGVLFGAVHRCEVCKEHMQEKGGGHVLLDGEVYRCTGWITEHLKCSFQTQQPDRSVWQLTPAAKKVANSKLGKMKLKAADRLFASKASGDVASTPSLSSTGSSDKPPLLNLSVVLAKGLGTAKRRKELAELVRSHGGSVDEALTKAACFVVSSEELVESKPKDVEAASALGVPGVTEAFLTSLEVGRANDMVPHLLWGSARAQFRVIKETSTATFVEKDGVSMDADVGELAEKAHVLVDRSNNCVYSEMLSQTDITSGANSFYTLHLLESDHDNDADQSYWVFRKWGRIGASQGGKKLEEFGTNKTKAIQQFGKLYLEKTGNTFGHRANEFKQIPGKFGRVDMEHKALKKGYKKDKDEESDKSKLEVSEGQPLGQLSKAQIEKGNNVLEGIESLLGEIGEGGSPSPHQSAMIKAKSAQYYGLIPHNFGLRAPPPIDTPNLVESEKALLQFYLRMGFEEMGGEEEEKLTPISGVMQLPLPASLQLACMPKGGEAVCTDKIVKSCVAKGKTMASKKAGKPTKPMDQELYGAILLYTANAIYQQLNKALRDEDRDKVKAFFAYLRLLFEACARLPTQKVTLWRGVGVDLYSQYKVGSTITWWGVSSCTSDQKVATNFAKGCAGQSTILTIETQTACDISQVSFFANESESILLPGTQLEVLSSEKKGNVAHIMLREIGRAVS
eukprot:TRINITY_DN42010_c0_g1_i1.p1 TRINITY_DN42010_c0_g1~~TRINITY_DN42010_c0_g1_i1.p1  ORF type:complete len:1022 (+),score=247.72 TRINITY_DN42010_c0_g1_i1:49-3066(+)